MNAIPNALNVSTATAANPAGGSATPSGDAGVFAQLLGNLTPPLTDAPAATAETAVDETAGTMPAPAAAGTASLEDAAAPDASREDDALPQADPALIAALLGQMQTPYAMTKPAATAESPAPGTAADGAAVAPAVGTAAGVAGAADAAATAGEASLAGTDANIAAAVDAQGTHEADPALDTAAAQLLSEWRNRTQPAATDATAATTDALSGNRDSDKPAVMTPPAPADDARRGRDAANVAIATPAAVAEALRPSTAASPRYATAQPAPATASDDGGVSDGRAALAGTGTNDTDSRAASARARLPDEFRRMMDQQSMTQAGVQAVSANTEAAAEGAAAALATLTAAAQSRLAARERTTDAVTDVTGVTAGLAAAVPVQAAPRGDTPAPTVSITPHLESPEWKPAFNNGMKMLVNEGAASATLQLNPAEFGPINVRIVMTDQRADITFMTHRPEANAAIQSALPDLRDQLARGGIQLGQTSVGGQAQQPRQQGETPQQPKPAASPAVAAVSNTPTPTRVRSRGSIDIYA